MDLFQAKSSKSPELTGRIEQWVRSRLRLDDEVVVMVSALRCTDSGCPPLETMIAVLEGPEQTRRYKFHKSMAEITANDIESGVCRDPLRS